MLQNIRDNIQGTMAKVIIAIIIVPFAIFGVEKLVGGVVTAEVAKVNGDEITEVELQQAISAQRRQIMSMLGENAQPSMLDEATLRGPALDNLITQRVLQQSAESLDLRVPDRVVDQAIISLGAFQEDGRFSPERYKFVLNSQGYTPAYFKRMLQQELLINQLHGGLASSDFVTDQELQAVAALLQQQRSFHYTVIPLNGLAADQPITEADEQQYYQANLDRFMREERIRLQYIEVKTSDFAKPASEEAIKAEYERERSAFKPVTERHAAHILIESNAERSDEQAAALAASLAKRVSDGEDFAKIAAKYSDDLGSKNNGGDHGSSAGDAFPAEFEQALAKMKEGEISPPV